MRTMQLIIVILILGCWPASGQTVEKFIDIGALDDEDADFEEALATDAEDMVSVEGSGEEVGDDIHAQPEHTNDSAVAGGEDFEDVDEQGPGADGAEQVALFDTDPSD